MRRTLARGDRTAHGVTLVEMLIALTMTLIVLGAVVTMFGMVGESVNDSRATIEMANRLRSASMQLRQDLEGITVTMLPPRRPEQGEGYFEYIEGPKRDFTAFATDRTLGDADDALFMTIRSTGEPFVTIVHATPVSSPLAEVVWFVAFDPNDPEVQRGGTPTQLNLYRRALLIQPGADGLIPKVEKEIADSITNPVAREEELRELLFQFHQKYDISARIENEEIVLNTLGDLSRREARFCREARRINGSNLAPAFPHVIPPTTDFLGLRPLGVHPNHPVEPPGSRIGQDIMLVNCKGFDVRLWDSTATVLNSSGTMLIPSDPGYANASEDNFNDHGLQTGAFVDLAYRVNLANGSVVPQSLFSNLGDQRSKLIGNGSLPLFAPLPAGTAIYDTWSFHYEHDGIDQDGIGPDGLPTGPAWKRQPDQGTNGIDDDLANGVDDPGEYEAPPPYAVPLRGVQVKIRCFETDSRQVREVTLAQDFLPQ